MLPKPSDRPKADLTSLASIWRTMFRALSVFFVSLAMAGHGMAQAPAASGGGGAPAASPEDLETLVSRIALYPDDLVAIILPASTFPLQIVQADRFLDKRKADPKLPIDENWDDSVKSLVNYPDVIKMMSNDLDWTSALGEAVVADQGSVLDAVQAFRRKVQAAGNLKSNDKQTVAVEKETITIVQSNPEVIYVPQYNPTTVVVAGAPAWGYYPTPYPVYYYPYAPGAAFATGLIWGAAIGAAWGGGHWGCNWGGGDININRNTNINRSNTNFNRNTAGQLPANRGGAGGSTAWKSDKRPGQVSGATGRQNTTGRVGDARAGSGGFGGAGGAGANRPSQGASNFGGGAAGANRPSQGGAGNFGGGTAGANRPTQGSGGFNSGAANRAGSVSASPRDSYGGSRGTQGGGFSGYQSGRQTGLDSSRGASSRSSMSGGARGGGGGGARGGGGGGRGGGGRR